MPSRKQRASIKKTEGTCRLCLKTKPLVKSHIIPGFVFRWQRETSATGYLRFGANPNKREQDGWKLPLLCGHCEQVLSHYERAFATTLFPLIVEERPAPYAYGPELAKFLASVTWRALLQWKDMDSLEVLTAYQREQLPVALERWRRFLLNLAPDVGLYELHFLPLGIMSESTIHDLPPHSNFYMARAVETHVASNESVAFVYVKMGLP